MARRMVLPMALVVLLAGCMGLPTSGDVKAGDVVIEEPAIAFPLAANPIVDATPEQLVSGFLSAGAAGLSDEFGAARNFLTAAAARDWNPRAGVVVYSAESGGPEVRIRSDQTVSVVVPVAAWVDEAGRYVEAAEQARAEELVFELVRNANDQWRISGLADGVVMSDSSFETLYRPTPLYFATPDRAVLVPDLRWYPSTNIATSAVIGLLEGPSPWLRDAVVSGVPEDTQLNTTAVRVLSDHTALVDLVPRAGLGDADRALFQAQLEATLTRLPGTFIDGVTVTVGGSDWGSDAALSLERDLRPEDGPYVLAEDRLALVKGREVSALPDAAALTGLGPHDPAVSLDGLVRVVLDARDRLLLLSPDGAAPVPLLAGTALVPPSIDRFNWIWAVEQDSDGQLTVVRSDGSRRTVVAEWLQGRTISSLRLSRDGTRVAITSIGIDQQSHVDVAAVVRDRDGQPLRLGPEPFPVAQALSDASEVGWVDESTLAVLGESGAGGDPTLHLVPVGGDTVALPHTEDTTGMAVGRGEMSLYLVDGAGALLLHQSNSWVPVVEGVRDPVFPG